MQNVALQLTSLWSINNQKSDHVDHMEHTYRVLVDWCLYTLQLARQNMQRTHNINWPYSAGHLYIHEIVGFAFWNDYCAQLYAYEFRFYTTNQHNLWLTCDLLPIWIMKMYKIDFMCIVCEIPFHLFVQTADDWIFV